MLKRLVRNFFSSATSQNDLLNFQNFYLFLLLRTMKGPPSLRSFVKIEKLKNAKFRFSKQNFYSFWFVAAV